MIFAVVLAFFICLILGVPIAFTIMIPTLLGIFMTGGNPLIIIQQIFNGLDNFVLLAIPFFIMAGGIAANGEIAKRLIDVAQVITGRMKGGLAIATVFACAFFAALTGSSLATIVAIGTIMIPALIAAGYPKPMATGLICTSGTLGILIPPSCPMVVLCVAMGTSVAEQFMAGFLPGILITLSFSAYLYFVCRRMGIGEIKKYTLRESLKIFKDSIFAIFFPIIVLGGIYGGVFTPTEAAAASLIYVLIIELFVYKKLKLRDLTGLLANAGVQAASLTFIFCCASGFVWLLTTQRVPQNIATFIINNIHSSYLFIFLMILLMFVAGCFMEVIMLVLILGPILIPTLTGMGINIIHFGIITIVMSQIGFVSPPFGMCLFVTMSVTKQGLWEVVRGALPFIIILTIIGVLVSYIPEISLFLPDLFYK